MNNSDAPSLRESPRPSLEQRLALFFDAMIEYWAEGSSPDGSDIQDVAHDLGLLTETKFNSDVHSDELGVGAEDGDPWFVLADDASAAVRVALAVQSARKDGSSLKDSPSDSPSVSSNGHPHPMRSDGGEA